MAEINAEQIAENAAAPKRAQDAAGSMEQFSIDEQIKADRYAKEASLKSKSKLPIRLAKIRPGGAI